MFFIAERIVVCLVKIVPNNMSRSKKTFFTLIAPVAMEDGVRFAIREGGRTVGAGVVAKVIE